jgi:hypothetical protein
LLEVIVTSTRTHVLAVAALLTVGATLLPLTADAQGRRGPRVVPRRGNVVVAGYYRPLFYDPFYDPWFPYRYGWYPPPYGYGYAPYNEASLRLQVTPRDTEVFVDGYYAGTVDSFDGVFQRLRLDPGEHDVTLYLSGYRTINQKILLQPSGTFRVRHSMEALPAGSAPEPRPVSTPRPRAAAPAPQGAGPSTSPSGADTNAFGSIAIRVQPADADVLIDGERWEGPGSDEALVVQIEPGSHRLEIRKDGYRPYTAQIDVGAGQTESINVSLPRQ